MHPKKTHPMIVEPKFSIGDRVKLRHDVYFPQHLYQKIILIEKNTEGKILSIRLDNKFDLQDEAISTKNLLDTETLYIYSVEFYFATTNSSVFYINHDLLRKVKEQTNKQTKLPLNAIHPDIGGSGYINPRDEMPQPSGVNILKKNNNSPRTWYGDKPDLTTSNNYQKALKMPLGEKREKAIKKALSKSKKQALKEGAKIH